LPTIDWHGVTTEVVAALIVAAILAVWGFASGAFGRLARRLRHRSNGAPPVSQLANPSADSPGARDEEAPIDSSLSEAALDVLRLIGRTGGTSVPVSGLAGVLGTNEIRLTVAVQELIDHGLIQSDPGSFVRMTGPSLHVTDQGSRFLVSRGLA